MGLEARDVAVRFGGLVALEGVSLVAPSGMITGLIGPNGAGKTTLFNVCCGYQRAMRGTVVLNGQDVTALSAVARARAGLGRTFQRLELFQAMTVGENVEVAVTAREMGDNPLSILGWGARTRRRSAVASEADDILRLVGMAGLRELPAAQLSTGQGRILELARCLARAPRMMLLDEPSSGLDVRETAELGDLICKLVNEMGVGVLIVEHDMSLVLRICERISVLDFGRLLFEGTPSEVRSSPEVQAAYLGQPADGLTEESAAR